MVVSGVTPAAQTMPGAPTSQDLELQFARSGSSSWQTLSSAISVPGARFTLSARLTMSGIIRVIDATPGAAPVNQAGVASSTTQRVAVQAVLTIRQRALAVLGGTAVVLHGHLHPGLRGRRVLLQARAGRGWLTLASGRSTARGTFTIRYLAGSLGRQQLRIKFSGDRLNTRASARAGSLSVYRQGVASWYYDGGSTACGFHALYGVASRSLPCGAKVQFRIGSRSVTAVVDDRGPYVGGRVWDLNQNTAAALGLVGVQTVWSTM
jgi:rare lipoprotein A